MKKTALAAGIIAMIAAGSFTSCSKSDDKKADNAKEKEATAKQDMGEGFESDANYRFYDPIRVMDEYTLARELDEKNQKADLELEKYRQSKENEFNNKSANIQNKQQQGGYLSEASLNADVKDLQRQYAETERVLSSRAYKRQEEKGQDSQRLNDSIMNFIKEYNATKHYDAIFSTAATLYYNPSLDITDEIIKGLNERYKSDAKASDKKEGKKDEKK